jgi:non-lysosomal glucosylceramidase
MGLFAVLESHHARRLYHPLGAQTHASFALAMLWPRLQTAAVDRYLGLLAKDSDGKRVVPWDGSGRRARRGSNSAGTADGSVERKRPGSAPADLGAPGELPFRSPNADRTRNSNAARDLNAALVLQVYRDYHVTRNAAWLADVYPLVAEALTLPARQDADGDALPDHDGAFVDHESAPLVAARGPSSGSGGLYLAAVRAVAAMAAAVGDSATASRLHVRAELAAVAYEHALWNGAYFNFDTRGPSAVTLAHADQLAGHFYLLACGLDSYLPPGRAAAVLRHLYDYHVAPWGDRGAVTLLDAKGRPAAKLSRALADMAPGVSYLLAATMLAEVCVLLRVIAKSSPVLAVQGMEKEAFALIDGVYRTVYDDLGLA